MNQNRYLSSAVGLLVIVVGVVAFNVIGSKLNVRVDATDDNIFTLTEGTEEIVGSLQNEVQVKYYFTRSQKELPVMIKTYATRVEEMLNEYASLSGGMLSLEVYDPKPDTDEEEWARKYGLKSAKLPSGNDVFHGAVLISGDKEIAIPYFDPRREGFLEYDVTEAVFRLTQETKNKIGIVSWIPVIAPELPPQYAGHQGGQADWVFVQQLKRMHEVVEIQKDAVEIAGDVNTVIVFHPKNPSDQVLYALDQFVLRGGRLIVFVDPFSRMDLAQSAGMGMQQRMNQEASSDLKKLFDAWDIEYKKDLMVGDLKHTLQINAGGQVVAYPFFMGLDEDSVSKDNVATSQLSNLLFAEPGGVALKSGSTFKIEPLIFTDKDSGTAQTTMAKFMGPAEFSKQIKPEEKVHNLAAIITGQFKTAFPNGAPQPEGKDAKKASGAQLKEMSGDTVGTVMVVTDIDFISDQNSVNKMQFGPQVIIQPRNDNLSFVINSVDYLGGDQNLISIRSRGKIARPFTKVQDLQAAAQKKWKTEEENLSTELSDLQKKLGELQAGRTSGNRFALSSEQQQEIEKFRERERQIRKRRREVRKNLREDIEALGTKLKVANLLFVPFGVGIFGLMVFMRRNRKRS